MPNIFNSCVIVWNLSDDGEIVVWVVDVDYNDKRPGELPVTKFPGGMSIDHPEDGDDPRSTGARELEEEVGLIVELDDLRLIHQEYVPCETSHWKYWYAAPRALCRGEVRPNGTVGKRSKVSAAYAVRLDELHHLHPKHELAFSKFVAFIEELFAPLRDGCVA